MPSKREQIHRLLQRKPLLRPRDLAAHGISAAYLNKLYRQGEIARLGRGVYASLDRVPAEHQSLLEACTRVPQGVVCLLSALQFHDLTTEMPFEVWLAIGEKARKPQLDYPPLRLARFSPKSLAFGVERHTVDGGEVRVYSPAKTVADCFKYRHKIGLEVALAALRDCWRKRQATSDAIWKAASVCRMTNVMRPYLEALT